MSAALSTNRRYFLLSSTCLASLVDLSSAVEVPVRKGEDVARIASTALPDLAPPQKQPENLKIPQKATKQAGWAIVGLGELALNEVLPVFEECKLSKPVALVSGHEDKARKVAEDYVTSTGTRSTTTRTTTALPRIRVWT